MVFVAGVDLVEDIFIMVAVRTLASWAVKTDFAQTQMRNITEYYRQSNITPQGMAIIPMDEKEL